MHSFILIASAFCLSLVLSFGALKFFPRWGLLDRPERYGLKRSPIPYPGGLVLVFGFLLLSGIFLTWDFKVTMLISATALLAITSFLDDRIGLPPLLRLGIQTLSACLLVLADIRILSITNPLGGSFILDSWQIPLQLGDFHFQFHVFSDLLTVLWIVIMVNAFNWMDGVPGIASGVSSAAALTLLLLSIRPGFHSVDQSLAIDLSSLLLGLSLGFLLFNFPPAKMLMGDTGSMMLGFLIAVTAIISGGKIATTVLVLGFPLLDFAWTILRRLWRKQSPWKGDLWHFHHQLLNNGFSERRVVLFFIATSLFFGALALFLHSAGKAIALGVLFLLFVLLLSLILTSKERK